MGGQWVGAIHLDPGSDGAEAAGILAWMVRGAVRWASDGLGEPAEVRAATAAYREDEDHLGRYLDERRWSGRIASRDLYSDYSSWCEEQGERPLSQKTLGRELSGRGWTAKANKEGKGWMPPARTEVTGDA